MGQSIRMKQIKSDGKFLTDVATAACQLAQPRLTSKSTSGVLYKSVYRALLV